MIGRLLKEELQSRGLILKFVARKTGIPYNSLVRYLNEDRVIPEPKLRCLCREFGIDPKIFGLDDNQNCQPIRKAAT